MSEARTMKLVSLAPLVAALAGCTFNVQDSSATVAASGPETGWTTLWIAQSPGRTLEVHGADAGAPTLSAAVSALCPRAGCEALLQATSVGFGAVQADGGELFLPTSVAFAAGLAETEALDALALTMPRDRALIASVWSADVTVDGLDGPVTIAAASGNVDVHTTGPTRITASNGDITAAAAQGTLTTLNGNVTLAWSAMGAMWVETSNGNVTVSLSADAGVALDLSTSNGDIHLDGATAARALVTTLKGGGPQLTVSTRNGNVTIVREP